MDKNEPTNIRINSKTNFFNRRLKILFLIACLILAWIILIGFLSDYISSDSEKNWTEISSEKINQQKETAQSLFNSYQQDLNKFSDRLTSNQEIRKLLSKSDSKKLFDEVLKLNLDNSLQVEIFNSRLELLAFKGRKLDSDIYSLQKCANGQKYSVIKEIGFYTYLIIYSPVYDPKETNQVVGLILSAKLIDIKNQISNKFFKSEGLIYDIDQALKVSAEIFPANVISGKIDIDSSSVIDKADIELKGVDNSLIGILVIPAYSKTIHEENIETLQHKIISLLIFALTVILFLIALNFIFRIESSLIKFILFASVMILIRYVWQYYQFPSGILESEIFSPGYFASTFGKGIARSIGELFITSLFILLITLYGVFILGKNKYIPEDKTGQKDFFRGAFISFLRIVFYILIFFGMLQLFGYVIESIVLDSNIKFLDRSSFVPSTELFFLQLIILLLSFSFFTILCSVVILIYKSFTGIISSSRFIRKYLIFIVTAGFLLINFLLYNFSGNLKIDNLSRAIIILLSIAFGFYSGRKISFSKKYELFSLKNFSVIILFCIIIIPNILLEKITSQETNFVELIGKKISENEDDRIKFLLITELSEISEDRKLEYNLKNKSKLPELAFSVWAESKFSEENFNTAVIILDTNKKIISDFIFNSQNLNSDSIVSYTEENYFSKLNKLKVVEDSLITEDSLSDDEMFEPEEEEVSDEIDSLFVTDKILLLKNNNDKYYLGIVPVEKIDLMNTAFAKNLGYVIIAVQNKSRNFLAQSSMQLFKNYSRDNLFDKLISTPVITEYIDGEIVSSTDPDLSKVSNFSLDAFREATKYKSEKSNWRYEIINNEKYRTFYILAYPDEMTGSERIFAISLKRNDFKLTLFFYLKFILFAVFIYLIVLSVILVIFLFRLNKFRFHFREKLFASFFIVSVIPIVLLAFYTRSFIQDKYDNSSQSQMISDLNFISQTVKGSKIVINNIDSLNKEQSKLLIKILAQSNKNFNIFLKSKLVMTTDDELYKSDLLDTRADADAYYNIIHLGKDFYSKTEQIGMYSFIGGYKPFLDSRNNVIGLISSQTVYRQNEINEELSEILTFIFGIYIIVIIILLVFVTFLADRISKPILRLQYATEKISKGESNVELEIKRKDEIGNLVQSFNKMTKELESSKDKLKRAEREAAWRDIARRVAHEIKNPLTPMKLSIQHLYEIYNNGGKEKFSETLKKTRNIIINEIDKLNRIATEFSNFAKLPGRNYEETDLNEIIEEVVSLYKLAPDIDFRVTLDNNIDKIFADKQELNRVFQNLIKNSIQATDDKGIIKIKTHQENGNIFAEVTDNGCGIDPEVMKNLFEPNFSTKTTGMGLGLAIAKKTLDDMKAEISFESNLNKGTSVLLKFKTYKNSNEQQD